MKNEYSYIRIMNHVCNKRHSVKGLRPGNSDLMVEEFATLRQVDTNIEMVRRQQTMKDLHVKYPKQRTTHHSVF